MARLPPPTRRASRRLAAHLEAPRGPAIAYTLELTHTVEAATIDKIADLVADAHERGHLAHARARDHHGQRPLTHDELGALIRRLTDRAN
ncbi:MAG: hypothetical protein WD844_08000 [Thermoleophilaceae bacterium]